VQDPKENVGVKDELVLVLSDIGIDDHGHLADPNSGGSAGMAFGREGDTVLVNGRQGHTLTARSGVPQRWRILNASKSRYFSLKLGGQSFTIIGTDGGLQERPTETLNLVIGAAERLDVIVTPKADSGTELSLFSYLFNRGYGSTEYRPPRELLLKIKFSDAPAFDAPPLPQIHRDIQPLDLSSATKVEMKFTLDKQPDGSVLYGINGVPFSKAKPFIAKEGETQIWTLVNNTDWTHPWHLHGFFFQVLDDNDVPVRPLAWKDTVTVPFKKSVKVAVKFDEGHVGKWMMHCHILDHADGGLMGTVQVGTPPPDQPTATGHEHMH
jgi:FtsP/CotA-like multicopper oxidase with cupredoxin domain